MWKEETLRCYDSPFKTRRVTHEVKEVKANSWLRGEGALCDIIKSWVPQLYGFAYIPCEAEQARDIADGLVLSRPSDLH